MGRPSFLVRPESWLWAICRFRATLSATPNFGFELCINKIDEDYHKGLDLRSLRMVANGAEPVSVKTLRRLPALAARCSFFICRHTPPTGTQANSSGSISKSLQRNPQKIRCSSRSPPSNTVPEFYILMH